MPFTLRLTQRFPKHCAVTCSVETFFKQPLAYFSNFWLLITLLLLSSGPAHAEWKTIGGNDLTELTVYMDPDTLRREGNLVKVWQLFDFKTARTYQGNSFLSVKAQAQFDCADERTRRLAEVGFSGNMGSGKPVYSTPGEGKWEPVAPGSVAEGLWKLACDKL